MSLRRPAGLLGLLVLALAGCADTGSTAPRQVTDAPRPGTATTGTATTGTNATGTVPDAAAALAAAGLTIPPSASAATVTPKPKEPFTDRYVVTLTAPPDQVSALCEQAHLNGPLVASGLTAEEREAFGLQDPPAGAHTCYGADPQDYRRNRRVLYAGDPATVWILVWQMPAR